MHCAVWRWLLSCLLCLLFWLGYLPSGQLTAFAQTLPATDETSVYDIIPDWSQFSFDDFGAIGTSGSVPDLGRSWKAGQSVADVLKLEDLADSLSPQDFSLSQIGQLSETDLTQISVSSFPLIANQKVSTLVEVVPRLGEFSLNEVAPLKTLFLNQGLPEQALGTPLSELLEQFTDFGQSSLSTLPTDQLSQINIADIPNIDIPQLQTFEGFGSQSIAQIPGLSQVPLSSFPNPIATLGSIIARIDVVYGPAENHRTDTISGSDVVGFDASCPDDGMLTNPPDALVTPAKCAYIELDDLENQGKMMQSSFEGKQWISGKYHAVKGGHGALANTPGMNYLPGFEPTGRHPFGPFFKHVIWEPDESTDQVSSALFFRLCDPTAGCTPYNQFSVPFLTYPVNSLIFVGALNEFGGAAPSASFGSGGATAGSPAIARSNPPCIQGVGGSNLGEAIAAVESQGSGDYLAIGNPTCDGTGLCGVALGRYQTMSYKESVQAVVGKVPGGAAWLDSLNKGALPTSEEILRYYPQAAQEEVFKIEITDLTAQATAQTDPTTGQPFTGDRLIERVAQMWYGGLGVAVDSGGADSNGVLTVYEYGVKARQIYQSGAKGVKPVNCTVPTAAAAQGDGKASGTLINPAPGSVLTSPFGVPRGDHNHGGIDLAGSLGDPILATDGGKISLVSFDANGYGNFIVVDHGNGTLTLYGHLDSVAVQSGQAVSAGQIIGAQGSTGRSTGPHLHFEVIQGATPGNPHSGYTVDPAPFLNL